MLNSMRSLVRLPSSGEYVNILTHHGADAYLLDVSKMEGRAAFFSDDLKKADNIRRKAANRNKRLNASDRQALMKIYDKIGNLSEYSDPKLFRELIPESEISAVLDHFVEMYDAKASDPTWINTGTMMKHDFPSLACIFAMFRHPVPVAMVLLQENGLLGTLAKMMRARHEHGTLNNNRHLPSEFADAITLVVHNLIDCSMNKFDNPWNSEKVFKKLDSIGFLDQYLRCTALPASGEQIDDAKAQTFDTLLTCAAFVNKRFKQGTPCGDTVRSLLNGVGRSGQPAISQRTLPYFQNFVKLSELLTAKNESRPDGVCFCCKKRDAKEKFMTCGRCRRAKYCSKECQKKHWKDHKKHCSEPPKSLNGKNRAALNVGVLNTVEKNYTRIMLKLVNVLDDEDDDDDDLHLSKMILVLDFTPDSNGKVPILQDPPEFNIFPYSKYLRDRRNSVERVFRWSEDGIKEEGTDKEVESVMKVVKERTERKASTDLFCIIRRKDASDYVTLDQKDPRSKQSLFSVDAVDGFRSVIRDNDYSVLSKIFSDEGRMAHVKGKLEHLLGRGVDSGDNTS